jgi:hypothetical protein
MKSLKFERIVTLDVFVHERRNNIDAKTCLFLFLHTFVASHNIQFLAFKNLLRTF